jgi:hypothetical protein
LALEFCRHRLHQLHLLFDVLPGLSQPQRRSPPFVGGARFYFAGRSATGRFDRNTRRQFAELPPAATKSLRPRPGVGSLQLHFFSLAHLATQLSLRFISIYSTRFSIPACLGYSPL